jgi:hypothetical protein
MDDIDDDQSCAPGGVEWQRGFEAGREQGRREAARALRSSGEAVAHSCANHVAGEIGYCRFMQPVAHEQALYLHPATVTDEDVERALAAPFDNYTVSSFVPMKSPANVRRWMRAALESFVSREME